MSLVRYKCSSNYLRINIYIDDKNLYDLFYQKLKIMLNCMYQIKSITVFCHNIHNYYHFIRASNIFEIRSISHHVSKLNNTGLLSISCLREKEYNLELDKFKQNCTKS